MEEWGFFYYTMYVLLDARIRKAGKRPYFTWVAAGNVYKLNNFCMIIVARCEFNDTPKDDDERDRSKTGRRPAAYQCMCVGLCQTSNHSQLQQQFSCQTQVDWREWMGWWGRRGLGGVNLYHNKLSANFRDIWKCEGICCCVSVV